MKIIFLDFDGVISTYEKGWRFDMKKLELLKEIVDKTDAKIVVTSSWKRGFTINAQGSQPSSVVGGIGQPTCLLSIYH